MLQIHRREFLSSSLAAVGAAAVCGSLPAAEAVAGQLPTVRWGKYDISRLLVGHNPLKGQSYTSAALDAEMRAWFDPQQGHDVELLVRCQQLGINTCQLGAPPMESLLRRFYARGGKMQWISTFYQKPGPKAKAELRRILAMEPRPIGLQQWGQTSDDLLAAGKLNNAEENLKLFRDTGLLVGLGAHDPRVIEHAEAKQWDVDFYQCCFYQTRHGEVWNDKERDRMVTVIRQVSKPCIGFKVLAGNHHTKTPRDVADALQFAFDHIKPTDVVLLGLWQRYKDQPREDCELARKILGAG
jgi:hypothetical protein